MTEYIYEVVSMKNGRMNVEHLNYDEFSKKYKITGINTSTRVREELQEAPRIEGFLGAMWGGYKDGKAVRRYESPEVYDVLSR